MKRDFSDYFFLFYLCCGGIYYSYDSYHKIVVTPPEKLFRPCEFSFLIHHLATILQLKMSLHVDHFPWYAQFLPSFHSFMVAFPLYEYNYHIYGVSLTCWIFGLLWMRRIKVYLGMVVISLIMVVPILFLAFHGCMLVNEVA